MKTGNVTPGTGMGIVMPCGAVGGRLARRVEAEGLERVKVRIEEMMAEVVFSRSYSAEEVVVEGCMVAAWGLILGRVGAVVVVRAVVVAMLAVSDGTWGVVGVGVGLVMGSVGVDGCGMPVSAVQISAIGGCSSNQGTVKRGLSQRLWVLGSS